MTHVDAVAQLARFSSRMQANNAHQRLSPKATAVMGVVVMAMGAFICALALGLVQTEPQALQAPRWVVFVCGAVFVCGGLAVMSMALGRERAAGSLFGLPIVIGLAVVLHWVAFGEGERSFQTSTEIGGVELDERPVPERTGRIVFGVSAVIIDVVLIAGLIGAWRQRRAARSQRERAPLD